jgi:hypothetical protein
LSEATTIVLVVLTVILAGVAILGVAMVNRRKLREMEYRERLAMIERGLVPPPELDPGGFERGARLPPESRGAVRTRTAGVLLVGLGLSLMLLISFVGGATEVGIGIGGAFALMGGAFLFNSMLLSRQSTDQRVPASSPRRPTSGGSEPPSNVAP